uniref:Uncharacterized protein n=1 Tax=Polytomella parva TaxID=51329 RepID=A0A7S0Y9W2_9CHLO|mmetsp:Transcript_1198/g.1748  ORF Transcript_1198/g.1748 Transcript_1198/m.1748 type:complete len:519 (+) Transcript_1198:45-1601(+)
MPPKKDAKKDDKKSQVDPNEAKFQEEIKQLEKANNDLQLEQNFMLDKFRQTKADNERMKAEISGFKSRLSSATEDYADILEHRQEQIKAEELKLKTQQLIVDKLESDIVRLQEEIKLLRERNQQQSVKLSDAAQMLKDKENLEDAVRKQHDLIEKQCEELKHFKIQIEDKDTKLQKAAFQIEELSLKSSATTDLRILFDDPWLILVSHARLKADIPMDREYNSLIALGLGKLLVLYGGLSKAAGAEEVGCEVAVLNVESSNWERPPGVRIGSGCYGHSVAVVGRTKMLVFGGIRGDAYSNDVVILNTDTMKWQTPHVKGIDRPVPRSGHATCCIREKLFVFGGVSAEGVFLNDLWVFDQDSSQWNHLSTFGQMPTPRRGSSLSATEDGRRLYVFGGFDGYECNNDVHYLDLEKLTWSPMSIHFGQAPEPRENASTCITSKYLLVSGGCTTGGTRWLGDARVLDLYSPRWECLDDGSWNTSLWLKPHGVYTTFYGNKLFALKPSPDERLWELMVSHHSF